MKLVATMLLTSAIIVLAGCRTASLGPVPENPKYSISITIDSIPSGADVYAIESDGKLGRRIGTTPFVHTCGLAPRYRVWDDTKEISSGGYVEAFGWGAGTVWKRVGERKVLVLGVALAKGKHSLAVASKEIWTYGETMKDDRIALTVPLKTLAQVNREMEIYLRQQALRRDQNINVYQQKDSLDSINSGLDALIKLHGIGAFNNR